MDFFGGTSTGQFGRDFDAIINDSRFGAVILNIDSPGGSVFGVKELSDKIYNARGRKPIVAVTNSFNASAAYWISTAADEMVVTPSGEIGSVGVVAVHQEISKAEEQYGVRTTIIKAGRYKAEGNFHEPLNDEAREAIQKRVDEYYDDFVSSVARNRGTTAAAVKSKFGEGRMFGAKEAVERGMADRIGTLEAVGVRMAGAIAAKKKAAINNAVVKLAKCR
jgi:signal peptide peptidase SppA